MSNDNIPETYQSLYNINYGEDDIDAQIPDYDLEEEEIDEES